MRHLWVQTWFDLASLSSRPTSDATWCQKLFSVTSYRFHRWYLFKCFSYLLHQNLNAKNWVVKFKMRKNIRSCLSIRSHLKLYDLGWTYTISAESRRSKLTIICEKYTIICIRSSEIFILNTKNWKYTIMRKWSCLIVYFQFNDRFIPVKRSLNSKIDGSFTWADRLLSILRSLTFNFRIVYCQSWSSWAYDSKNDVLYVKYDLKYNLYCMTIYNMSHTVWVIFNLTHTVWVI